MSKVTVHFLDNDGGETQLDYDQDNFVNLPAVGEKICFVQSSKWFKVIKLEHFLFKPGEDISDKVIAHIWTEKSDNK